MAIESNLLLAPAGRARRETMLLVSEPVLGDDEKLALARVIDSNWITMGHLVAEFEQSFAELHGAPEAVAVSNCTAGLHLALAAFGLGPGDEVLVPSLSFVATANAVIYAGATPVFVDIDGIETPVMSLRDAQAKVTPRTKAVVVMHYAGAVMDPEAWRGFANRNGLILIEDSAHAVGAERGPVYGDAAVFSFFGNKNMTTAEGGMVVADDPAVLRFVRQARGHGMTASTIERLRGAGSYDVTMLGYNYRMTELNAAIGLVQMPKLKRWNAKRRRLSADYRKLVATLCPSVIVPFKVSTVSTHHILPAVLPVAVDRKAVATALRDEGIQTSFHYPPIHRLTWYEQRDAFTRLPITEEFSARELTLPLHPKMEEWQVRYVVQTLARALEADGQQASHP